MCSDLNQRRIDQRNVDWALYDWLINRVERKQTIRKLISYGATPREAIQMLREIEARDE
jgi:hypothetical protein